MEKQKTALCLAIERIEKFPMKEDIKDHVISILEQLKPTEREIIENFAIHRIYFNPKELDTEEYFNEHLTQD